MTTNHSGSGGAMPSFLSDVLTVGGVHQDDITRLEQVLDLHAAALHQGRPAEPAGPMFGSSDAGADLDLQTMRAYTHVREAVDQLVLGLQKYRENIVMFAKDYDETDTAIGGDLSKRQQNLTAIESCTAQDDFHDRSVAACEPPSSGSEG